MTRKIFLLMAFVLISASATAIGDIEITEVSVPDAVEKGEDFTVTASVENRGSTDEMTKVVFEAMGQKSVSREKLVEPGKNTEFRGEFTVPMSENTGPFTVSFKADSSSDFDFTKTESEISSITGYMTLTPEKTSINSPVLIKGRLRHSMTGKGASHLTANIYEGNRFITKIKTDSMGYFKTYFTPERTGSHTIRLVNEGTVIDRKLIVKPVTEIGDIELPDRIVKDQSSEVCIEPVFKGVNSVEVKMEQELDTKTETYSEEAFENRQETCFPLNTQETGLKTGEITVKSGRYSSTRTFNYMVEEKPDNTGIEITDTVSEIEGDQLTITSSVSHNSSEKREMTARIKDHEETRMMKTFTVNPGEKEKISFRLEDIPEKPVELEVSIGNRSWNEAIKVPEKKNETGFTSPAGMIGYSITGIKILGGVLAVAMIVVLLLRIFNPNALEPQK